MRFGKALTNKAKYNCQDWVWVVCRFRTDRGIIMKISDKIIKGVKEDWKVQTFQYDYLSHLKKKFVVGHFSFYLLTWVLMGLLQKDFFLFLQIPCMASWNYFVFFDKKYRAYKDDYKYKKYEFIGTLFATIGFSVFICLICL